MDHPPARQRAYHGNHSMRRAILPLILALAGCAALATRCLAQDANLIVNGIGLIDFSHGPKFKVGNWVRYHVTGHGSLGHSQDFVMTVGIAGEERFWGEDGFWVETVTESKDGQPNAVATLVSYSIFSDSLAIEHLEFYTRKNITESNIHGEPEETMVMRPGYTLRGRPHPQNSHWYADTLGLESVTVSKGTFNCRKIHIKSDIVGEVEHGDSTFQTETREDRDSYVSHDVPICGIVRETIDHTQSRKAWLVGRSQGAVTNVLSHSLGQADLVDFGDGYEPQVLAPSKRHTLLEEPQDAGSRPAAAHRVTAPAKRGAVRK